LSVSNSESNDGRPDRQLLSESRWARHKIQSFVVLGKSLFPPKPPFTAVLRSSAGRQIEGDILLSISIREKD
jgi:hypothetical protein